MEDIYVNLFWKCVCYTPSSLVTYYVMAKMLNISKRWRFMIGVTLLHILLTIATAVALDHGLPGADTMRVILQSAIYLGAAMLSSRELPDLGIEPASLTAPALAGGYFTTRATWEAHSKH